MMQLAPDASIREKRYNTINRSINQSMDQMERKRDVETGTRQTINNNNHNGNRNMIILIIIVIDLVAVFILQSWEGVGWGGRRLREGEEMSPLVGTRWNPLEPV